MLAMLLVSSQIVYAVNETQNILINEELQIPGAVLPAGKYALSVAEHFYNRAIVKISRVGGSERYLDWPCQTRSSRTAPADWCFSGRAATRRRR
jgi:hypothetical protein